MSSFSIVKIRFCAGVCVVAFQNFHQNFLRNGAISTFGAVACGGAWDACGRSEIHAGDLSSKFKLELLEFKPVELVDIPVPSLQL